jgi:hypothetical protein
VRGDLDDEVGVQGCGDPVQERDCGDDASGFEAGQCRLGHSGSGSELVLGQAEGEAAVSDCLADEVGECRAAIWTSRRLRNLARAAGVRIGRTHPHMLRYTFVTTMLDAGVDLGSVPSLVHDKATGFVDIEHFPRIVRASPARAATRAL